MLSVQEKRPDKIFYFYFSVIVILIGFPFQPAQAEFDLKCYMTDSCNNSSHSTNNPSTGNQVKINPSAVPTEAGFGLEGIFYKDQVDVALIRGTGRVGAAISPSNSEETFFGPPGFENLNDYSDRKQLAEKFPNQKYTLAAAMTLIEKKGSDLNAFTLKAGVMIKYNRLTKGISPGAGINGYWGPFSFGGSMYNDQTQLNDPFDPSALPTIINYQVQTYNVGLFLNSLILDYSKLKLKISDVPDTSEVTLLTACLLIKKFILTVGKRTEDSLRPNYNYDTHQLETMQLKDSYFLGVQYRVNKNLMLGVFYDYYLLRENSLSATLFF